MKTARKQYLKDVRCVDCGAVRSVNRYTYPKRCPQCAHVLNGDARRGKPNLKARKGRTSACVHCAKPIVILPCEPSKKFCSTNCHDLHRQKYARVDRTCETCGASFRWNQKPFSNSNGRFCSLPCKYMAFATGVNVKYKPTKEQARAVYHVGAAIKRGDLVRPESCEQCGVTGRLIEAAHYDYSDPLRVRWLCAPCHRAWDYSCPKGGAIRVQA